MANTANHFALRPWQIAAVRDARMSLKHTISSLAEACRMDDSTLYRILAGKPAHRDTLGRIATFLEIPLNENEDKDTGELWNF